MLRIDTMISVVYCRLSGHNVDDRLPAHGRSCSEIIIHVNAYTKSAARTPRGVTSGASICKVGRRARVVETRRNQSKNIVVSVGATPGIIEGRLVESDNGTGRGELQSGRRGRYREGVVRLLF